jgi:hypothetical protein
MPRRKGKPSKSDAIRKALPEMGGLSASPTDVAKKLKAQGIPVTPQNVSQVKLELRKRRAKAGPRAPRTTPQPAVSNGTQVNLDDVLAVRALVRRIGTENLKKLADALAD